MRLLNCQLQNVRLHGDLELTFSPRLTLIGGANESGKSTLVEALHRALFLKASATGGPVEALQSRLHMGQPVVQLGFEARGDAWTLRKRFSGASGQVTLQAASSGQTLSGPSAEEVLAELLGVNEIVGSRQAGTVLPGRWAHLWVRQGLSGADPFAAGKSSYDFDQLRLQLERSGGAAVQQSALDQRVEQRIEAALAENFTSRGTRKHSPLYQREEALAQAQAVMVQALDRLADYESAGEELADIVDELTRLQNEQLPALQQRQRQLQEGAEAAGRLDGAIELARQTLEPIRLRHQGVWQTLEQRRALRAEIEERQQRLMALEASAAVAQSRQGELEANESQCREQLRALTHQRQILEQRRELLQRLVERCSSREALDRLRAELEQRRQGAAQRQELEQQLAALPVLTRQGLQELRQLERQRHDAQTRQQAIAAGVTVLRADQPVRLNGQALQMGEEQRLTAVAQLQVGDGVLLEIAPGGGQALEDLERTLQNASAALDARLAALGITGVEAAEALLEQRMGLEQQLAALATTAPLDGSALERQLEELTQRLSDLDAELQELVEVRQALEQEQALPETAAALQALHQQINATGRHANAAVLAAEQALEAARLALQQFQQQRLREASQLEVVRSERADRAERLAQLAAQQGSDESLAANLQTLAQARQQAEAQLQALQADRAALGSLDGEREQQRLQEQMDALSQRLEVLLDQRGAAKQRCDSISADDPFAAVEQARLQLETAEAEHRQLVRLTEAHQLLWQLFQDAQADLSSRYSEPLAQAIGDYLRPLLPDGPAARLSYDQGRGFQGLELRRGQEFYGFEALSGGMREQLAAALRLSMADVLKGAHDGCLPLVFDDAFTNSDPARIDLVKRMLGTAVDRGLQVILLTCDPAAYGSFADQQVELGSVGEA